MNARRKLHCWVWILVFAGFSILQLNDPDPLPWSIVYLLCSLLWFAELIERQKIWIIHLAAVCFAFWMGTLSQAPVDLFELGVPADLIAEMSPEKPYIEEAREFFGLGICAISLLILFESARLTRSQQ